uniref:Uncharacterized protein n=1 Tax=Loa loa TaxID=7209 RepID=A0A1I7V9U7_LOALO
MKIYKTWLNGNRTEGPKLLMRVPVEVRNPFGFGGLQLPRANSGSCRMRERPHIDRSQSNIYPLITIYVDGGGPRQPKPKPTRQHLNRRNLTAINWKFPVWGRQQINSFTKNLRNPTNY